MAKVTLEGTPEQMKKDMTLIFCPKADSCDHDWSGWRDLPNGGEAVCVKCGMGAMHHSLIAESRT